MKWFVFVEGGLYSGDTGMRVIEFDHEPAFGAAALWAHLCARGGLCGDAMDDVKVDGLRNTRLRVFKAEEIEFPFLDTYVDERMIQEHRDREKKNREAEEEKLKALAAKLGFRVEKVPPQGDHGVNSPREFMESDGQDHG